MAVGMVIDTTGMMAEIKFTFIMLSLLGMGMRSDMSLAGKQPSTTTIMIKA